VSQRLPQLAPEDLDEARRSLYHSIIGGPRGEGRQDFALADSHGHLNGPFGVLLHAPQVGSPLERLGVALRFETSLTAREREIATLVVAAALRSEFEWYAHSRIARSVGLTDSEIAALEEAGSAARNPREAAVERLTRLALAGDADPGEAEFVRLRETLGAESMIEAVVLAGYYWTLAHLMSLFAVSRPE
jgi:4-carboxymuconolactone decarboxylase